MSYDTSRLAELGARWQRLEAHRERLRREVHVEILAALAGDVSLLRVRALTGYQADAVRQIVYRNRIKAVGDLPLRSWGPLITNTPSQPVLTPNVEDVESTA